MANLDHVAILKRGTAQWNQWRAEHPDVKPDFADSKLAHIVIEFGADLSNADFSFADISSARFPGANLSGACLDDATLKSTYLKKANLSNASLQRADLSNTSLERAWLDGADFREAKLVDMNLNINSCAGTMFQGAKIVNVEYAMTPAAAHYGGGEGPLAFAEAQGLDHLHSESAAFLEKLAFDACEFARMLSAPAVMGIWAVDSFDEVERGVRPPGPPQSVHKLENPFGADPDLVADLLSRIRQLRAIYTRYPDDSTLVTAVQAVNSDLISFLRKYPKELHRIHWRRFEELIAELLHSFGWEVELTRPSKDGGYDMLGIYRDESGVRHSWIIECKKWAEERRVGVDIARALYTVKQELGVGGALLATTSNFTAGVHSFKASRYDFDLRDHAAIIEWINAYKK
jgi:hypothetical protein